MTKKPGCALLIIYYVPLQRQAAKITCMPPWSMVVGRIVQHLEPRTWMPCFSATLWLLPTPAPLPQNDTTVTMATECQVTKCFKWLNIWTDASSSDFASCTDVAEIPQAVNRTCWGLVKFLILTPGLHVPPICGWRREQAFTGMQRFCWKMAAQAAHGEMQLIDAFLQQTPTQRVWLGHMPKLQALK